MARKSPSAAETGLHEALAPAIPIWIAWLSGSRSGVPAAQVSSQKQGANLGAPGRGVPHSFAPFANEWEFRIQEGRSETGDERD